MIQFKVDPPLLNHDNMGPFMQTITMMDGSMALGIARWHSPGDVAGVAQVLDLSVSAGHQRKGFGKRLLQAVVDQARDLHKSRGMLLRRVWIGIEQKQQVIGRSFITSCGYHHVGTVSDLYRGQDLMLYVKSLD